MPHDVTFGVNVYRCSGLCLAPLVPKLPVTQGIDMTTVRLHLLSILFAATTYGALTGAVPGDGTAPAAIMAGLKAVLPAFNARRADATPVQPVPVPHRAVHSVQSPTPRATEVVYALR